MGCTTATTKPVHVHGKDISIPLQTMRLRWMPGKMSAGHHQTKPARCVRVVQAFKRSCCDARRSSGMKSHIVFFGSFHKDSICQWSHLHPTNVFAAGRGVQWRDSCSCALSRLWHAIHTAQVHNLVCASYLRYIKLWRRGCGTRGHSAVTGPRAFALAGP